MTRITRRAFLLAAGVASSVALLRPRLAKAATAVVYSAVPLQYVSAFAGPFMAAQLNKGQHLKVDARRGRVYVSWKQKTLGWIPAPVSQRVTEAIAEGSLPQVEIEEVLRDSQGRLRLLVDVKFG